MRRFVIVLSILLEAFAQASDKKVQFNGLVKQLINKSCQKSLEQKVGEETVPLKEGVNFFPPALSNNSTTSSDSKKRPLDSDSNNKPKKTSSTIVQRWISDYFNQYPGLGSYIYQIQLDLLGNTPSNKKEAFERMDCLRREKEYMDRLTRRRKIYDDFVQEVMEKDTSVQNTIWKLETALYGADSYDSSDSDNELFNKQNKLPNNEEKDRILRVIENAIEESNQIAPKNKNKNKNKKV